MSTKVETMEATTNASKEEPTAETGPSVYSEEVNQDKELKKQILIDLVASYCNETSEFKDFRVIGEAMKAGEKLTAKVISGGVTNYSYKVFLEGEPDGAPSFFAKIAFPYALWNPDRSVHYDVARTANEFKIMKRFKEMMGDGAPVAKPYLCVDVEDTGMKILVVEWTSNADEQWANQFIDGEVDHRVIPKLAKAIAALNLAPLDDEFDEMYNDNVRPCMRSMFPLTKQIFAQAIEGEGTVDSCVAYMKEMGQEKYDALIDGLDELYMTRDCINHSDTQCFNLLVEKKPSIDKLQTFGDNGDLVICDWEMSMAGPHGRDAGIVQCWPVACALTHAANGHKVAAYDILDCCVDFWDEYAKVFVEQGGKDEAFMTKTFRSSMGWCAMYLYIAKYQMGLFIENLPTDDLSEDMNVRGKGSLGLTGLKFFEYAFGNKEPDLTLEELRGRFRGIIECEIEILLEAASKYRARPRRASVLRAQGRRVSDAMDFHDVARRLSVEPEA